jgi:DNA-binding NarL/FixJ family response regulator
MERRFAGHFGVMRSKSTTERLRVYHCDDSTAFRRLVQEALLEHPDLELVGAAGSYAAALEEAAGLTPDVIVLDLHTGDEGDDPVARVRAALPDARIVVLSGSDAEALATADAQADAAVSKARVFEDLADAVRSVTRRVSA